MIKGISAQVPRPVHEVEPKSAQGPGSVGRAGTENRFDSLLKQKIQEQGVRFSRHAVDRMASRNIQIGQDDLQKINGAIDRAAEKGAKDSLVVMDQHAFVVSVENRTVITAMDKKSVQGNLFTNIDSAIVL